jgi:hypothetical protein
MKLRHSATLLFFLCTGVYAQETSSDGFKLPRHLIKIAPLKLFTNTLEISLESFNAQFSRSFQASVGLRSGGYGNYNGVSLDLAYKKYVAPMAYHTRGNREYYQGLYYSFFINGSCHESVYEDYNYWNGSTTVTEVRETIYSTGSGFSLGWHKTLWKALFLDVYVGGGIRFSDVQPPSTYGRRYYDITEPGYEGIYPVIGARIGVGL